MRIRGAYIPNIIYDVYTRVADGVGLLSISGVMEGALVGSRFGVKRAVAINIAVRHLWVTYYYNIILYCMAKKKYTYYIYASCWCVTRRSHVLAGGAKSRRSERRNRKSPGQRSQPRGAEGE